MFGIGNISDKSWFTRNTPGGYRFNSAGLLVPTVSGEPLIDFDPVTGAARGMFLGQAYTNLLTYSEQFDNAAWSKRSGTSITPNATTAPDGTLTADLMYDSGVNSTLYARSNAVMADNTIYTSSIFVKKKDYSQVRLGMYAKSAANDLVLVTLNFDTKVATLSTQGTVSNANGGAIDCGGGWWLLWVSLHSATGAINIPLEVSIGTAGSGSGLINTYVWGAQITATAFPMPYIKTEATTVARDADSFVISGTDFSDLWNPVEGTIFVEGRTAKGVETLSQYIAHMDDGTSSNRIIIYRAITRNVYLIVRVGGVDQAFINVGLVSDDTSIKIAASWKQNDFNISCNGVSVAADTVGTMPVVSNLRIGGSVSSSYNWNSTVKRLSYHPRAPTIRNPSSHECSGMIDYLFCFPDQVAAEAAFPFPEEPVEQWYDEAMRSIRPCRSVVARAVHGEEGEVVTPEVVTPGFWLRVRTAEREPAIEALTECLAAFDVERGAAGEPFVYFCRLMPDTLITIIEPALDIAEYPNLIGQPASALVEHEIG